MTIHLHFGNGDVYPYRIPVVNIHAYSLADIKEKHLCILIPFLPLQFRRILESKRGREKITKKELTSFYQEIILFLDEEVKNNYLNEYDREIILELLRKSLIRIFYHDKQLLKEVLIMTEPDFKLEHEEIYYMNKLQKEKLFEKEHELFLKNNEIASMQDEIALLKKQIASLQKA